MVAGFFERGVAKPVFWGHHCTGLKPPKHRATPPSSSPSSSAAPASFPSSPPYPKPRDLVKLLKTPVTLFPFFSFFRIWYMSEKLKLRQKRACDVRVRSSVSVPSVRSCRKNGEPRERGGGPSLVGELARLPSRRRDRPPRRRVEAHPGVVRWWPAAGAWWRFRVHGRVRYPRSRPCFAAPFWGCAAGEGYAVWWSWSELDGGKEKQPFAGEATIREPIHEFRRIYNHNLWRWATNKASKSVWLIMQQEQTLLISLSLSMFV